MPLLVGRRRIVLLVLFAIAFLYPTARYWYDIQTTLTFASSPLWATPSGPQSIFPHYHASGLWATDEICRLHSWKPRSVVETIERDMWDALILDGPTEAELDLLELRLHEHYEVVDKVFIVESNRTINGTPKRAFFNENRFADRFSLSQYKFVYKFVPAPPLDSFRSPSPEAWSARMQDELTGLIRSRSSNTLRNPIVIFSSLDELPAGHVLRLLRDCEFPTPLHLQLRRYMYSYEWPIGWGSWRAQVHIWNEATRWGEGKGEVEKVKTHFTREQSSDWVLADAGWHCSYCYKNLEDLVAKMEDEYKRDASSLTPERIQTAICEGSDLFNILPEAYTYKDLLQLWKPEPSKSAVGIPMYVIDKAREYKYLLPGGCERGEKDVVAATDLEDKEDSDV